MAKNSNEFFTDIEPSLTRKIPVLSKPFESFSKKASTCKISCHNRIKGQFSLPKDNKYCDDEIFLNVIKNCFGELSNVLKYVFGLSLLTGIFSDLLKIAK